MMDRDPKQLAAEKYRSGAEQLLFILDYPRCNATEAEPRGFGFVASILNSRYLVLNSLPTQQIQISLIYDFFGFLIERNLDITL